jgi:hypothetical protein
LLADPKERAEHLMLLDLGRNDVGRVSQIGRSVSIIRIIATIKLPSMSKTKTGIVLIVILYLNMIVLASGLLIRFSLKR